MIKQTIKTTAEIDDIKHLSVIFYIKVFSLPGHIFSEHFATSILFA